MEEKTPEKKEYCPECGIVEGSEPLGVPCSIPNCPNNQKKK